jgi:hypothetical protein
MHVSSLYKEVSDPDGIALLRSRKAAPDDGEAERMTQQEQRISTAKVTKSTLPLGWYFTSVPFSFCLDTLTPLM